MHAYPSWHVEPREDEGTRKRRGGGGGDEEEKGREEGLYAGSVTRRNQCLVLIRWGPTAAPSRAHAGWARVRTAHHPFGVAAQLVQLGRVTSHVSGCCTVVLESTRLSHMLIIDVRERPEVVGGDTLLSPYSAYAHVCMQTLMQTHPRSLHWHRECPRLARRHCAYTGAAWQHGRHMHLRCSFEARSSTRPRRPGRTARRAARWAWRSAARAGSVAATTCWARHTSMGVHPPRRNGNVIALCRLQSA